MYNILLIVIRKNGLVQILIIILVSVLVAAYFIYSSIPAPTPYQFPYKNPNIPKNRSYRIILVGDSIVNSLGINANLLREGLIKYYPDSEFVTYNYGYPSTNVLSLYQRLTDSILTQQFELIIIESFGNNPLSQFPLVEGLQKQNEELEKSVRAILLEKPNAALAFLTPIALDPINYAKGSRDLSPEIRKQWVEERLAYINNHKRFAEEKGIPIIDVFKASLKPNGEVDRSYISNDFIHPSKKGVELISQTIADYIFTKKIFPIQ